MSIASTETAVVKDIDTVLVNLAATIDKVRTEADKVNAAVQKLDGEFLVKVIPGLEPIATVVTEISGALDAVIDALDTIADGLAANAKTAAANSPTMTAAPVQGLGVAPVNSGI